MIMQLIARSDRASNQVTKQIKRACECGERKGVKRHSNMNLNSLKCIFFFVHTFLYENI